MRRWRAWVAFGAAGLSAAVHGDTVVTGHVEAGMREVDISGDEEKYRQYLNVDDGPRLFSAAVSIKPERADGVPDLVEVRLRGLGGDPYESIGVNVRKYGAYRFKYDRHVSEYFYEDLLLLPQDASVEKSTGGDFHHFDFERTRDRAELAIDVSERAEVSFDFDRFEKLGESTTTLDVEREEFELDQPVDQLSQRYGAGLQYRWDKATLTLQERWQEFENSWTMFLPGFSPGLEPAEPTELDFFFLDQPYEYDAREHVVGLAVRPMDKLDLRFNLVDVDLELDLDVAERSQGLNFRGVPFVRDLSGAGDVDRNTTLVQAGVSYAVTDRVELGLNLRRNALDQDGSVVFDGVTGTSDWELDSTSVELFARALVRDDLHVSAGWSRESRDSEFRVVDADGLRSFDDDTERDGFNVQLSYRPSKELNVTLSIVDNSIDDPFSLASATDTQRYRLRGRYAFDNGLSVTGSYNRTRYENDNSDWESETEQFDVRLAHDGERLHVSLGIAEIDVEREIDQLVTGGSRQDLFAIRYAADASFLDAAARYRLNDDATLSAAFRAYDNDGSFDVERDDLRLGLDYRLPQSYIVRIGYRNVDYDEDSLESFDADIWEVALRYDW